MQRADLVGNIVANALRKTRGIIGAMPGNEGIADRLSGKGFTDRFSRIMATVLKELGYSKAEIEEYERERKARRPREPEQP